MMEILSSQNCNIVVFLFCIRVFGADGLNLNIAFYWAEWFMKEVMTGSCGCCRQTPLEYLNSSGDRDENGLIRLAPTQ